MDHYSESNGLVTDNVYCLVKIIEKDERIIAAVQLEIKLFDFFSTSLNSSLIIFIRTYTVNYRNALDRHRVREHYIVVQIFLTQLVIKWRSSLHLTERLFLHYLGKTSKICVEIKCKFFYVILLANQQINKCRRRVR